MKSQATPRTYWLSCICGSVVYLAFTSRAFYLPGVAPTEYSDEQAVDLRVAKLTSVRTHVPYSYYYLNFCPPEPQKAARVSENLGEVLSGDDIINSAYDLRMKVNETCRLLCRRSVKEDDLARFRKLIEEEYQVNWLVDNMPAATKYSNSATGQTIFGSGFPVGAKLDDKYYLNNHVRITVKFHSDPSVFKGSRIVGFEVEPGSVTPVEPSSGASSANLQQCDGSSDPFEILPKGQTKTLVFTYDVCWEESPISWASRWDHYLRDAEAGGGVASAGGGAGQIHWFSIINSVMIVLFLSGMIAMILLRTLHRDIARYNELAAAATQPDDMYEETGWKLVHGDVFRKPNHSKLLAVAAGSGLQILGMGCVIIVFAILGFLSPAHRGAILQAVVLIFMFLGGVAGYASARIYKLFRGEDWKRTTLLTAFLYPGIVFSVFFMLNLGLWTKQSSGAVPFPTMIAMLLMWFGVSVPLVFVGAYMGYKKATISLPVRTHQIPREIPVQPWFIRPFFTCMVGGVLPFGAIFTELFFILGSIWQHQMYYLFGFLTLVVIILIITCAEISIALTYFQLTAEDYRWWWRSFLASASSAVYVFAYSYLYFTTRLRIIGFVPTMLYFGYMGIISISFFLLTGAIGFVATFWFVRAIYGSIKID